MQSYVHRVLLNICPDSPVLWYPLRVQNQKSFLLLQTVNAVSITPDRLACGAGRLIALPRAQLVQGPICLLVKYHLSVLLCHSALSSAVNQ